MYSECQLYPLGHLHGYYGSFACCFIVLSCSRYAAVQVPVLLLPCVPTVEQQGSSSLSCAKEISACRFSLARHSQPILKHMQRAKEVNQKQHWYKLSGVSLQSPEASKGQNKKPTVFLGDLRWVARFGLKWAKSVQAKSKHLQAASSKSMSTALSWSKWGLIWDLLGSLVHFGLGIMHEEGICQIWICGFLRSIWKCGKNGV